MEIVAAINRTKYDVFRWRYELSIPKKLVMAVGMAALTGLVAQMKFYLPWTPVPITGQTFAVLLAGVLLGRRWGGASLAAYVGIGAAGVPWFAPQAGAPIFSNGGMGVLTGATGGYLIGFIFAALFLGHFTDKYVRSRSFLSMFVLMLFANFILIHGSGLLWLNFFAYEAWLGASPVLGLGPYEGRGLLALLMVGTIPFIIGDIVKAAAAAAIVRGVTPKQAYNGEVDKDKWANWRIP
ncbi:MAG: biotin transporter BioY [Dehalococcoidales bacterium]|jgi:biotin transport system substrate-specific component|nr:biotin transporter BioY [Dehalococcoidales bacterium]